MIRGAANRRQVLGHVHRLLRPGGKLVLHVHNRWFSIWNPLGRRWLIKDLLRSFLPGHAAGDQIMPYHQGVANLYLHLFTKRELRRLLDTSGFDILAIEPIGLSTHGKLRCPWWFGWLRAQGYLALAQRMRQ
jgi:hypothetical protein